MRCLNDTRDLRYDVRVKRIELHKLFTDPKTDEATLLARERELNGLVAKLMDRKAQMKVEARKVFTPDQLRMLDMRGHRGHHFFGGRHEGPAGDWGHGRMQTR
jgi:hypothetical protein